MTGLIASNIYFKQFLKKLWTVLILIQCSVIFAQEKTCFLSDRTFDDFGSGEICYPEDSIFYPGCFDLTGVKISATTTDISISITFRSAVKSPPDLRISELYSLRDICTENFYCLNADIYLYTQDPLTPDVTWLLPGRKANLAAGYRWDRLLLLSPTPHLVKSKLLSSLQKGYLYAQSQNGSQISKSKAKSDAEALMDNQIFIPTGIKVEKNQMIVNVPKSWFPDSELGSWRVQVVITGAEYIDSINLSQMLIQKENLGNLFVREISTVPSQWHFGGATGLSGESNIIDILDTSDWDQKIILSRYSEGQYCRIPMVALSDLQKP